ncbi:MAG: phosphopantetheine-binding protein, partial [Myxococcota bacterium]
MAAPSTAMAAPSAAMAASTPTTALVASAVATAQAAPVMATVQAAPPSPGATEHAPAKSSTPTTASTLTPENVEVAENVIETMLEVVAEKTGYPADMLHADMNLEADLGIDSIKRVEILSAVRTALPNLPEVDPGELGALQTLGEIADAFKQHGEPAQETTTTSNENSPGVIETMLEVVAEKTGYPADMLHADMNLEADLGIDSIKRVEILSAVRTALPNLPEVDPGELGALQTLGEIADAFKQHAPTVSAPTPQAAAPTLSKDIVTKMLEVVAEKTGYPADMLNASMNLEADLGIDSIKRVEILSALRTAMPELPEVDPAALGALQTLGEIAEAFGSESPKVPSSTGIQATSAA